MTVSNQNLPGEEKKNDEFPMLKLEIASEPNITRTNRRPSRKIPAWKTTWRVLVVIAVINLSLWGYFHFVKRVDYLEGLAQLRYEIQKKINEQTKNNQVLKKYVIYTDTPIIKLPDISINFNENNNEHQKKERKITAVYSWINEKGIRCFSNIGFPKDEKFTDARIDYQ